MKATMIAINPPHTTNIFDGKKVIEWRTFKMPIGWHFAYETKKNAGSGMVIGNFTVVGHHMFQTVDEIPEYIIEAGCVSREFLKEYSNGKPLYANFIFFARRFKEQIPHTAFKRYTNPKREKNTYRAHFFPIAKFGKKILPPQSYMYIEVDENAFEY